MFLVFFIQVFSLLFLALALCSDVICLMVLPIHWLFFAASTYVWVQFVWHTGISKLFNVYGCGFKRVKRLFFVVMDWFCLHWPRTWRPVFNVLNEFSHGFFQDRGLGLPTISMWLLFIYVEASVRLKELKNLPFHLDLCRPFAAHW